MVCSSCAVSDHSKIKEGHVFEKKVLVKDINSIDSENLSSTIFLKEVLIEGHRV